MDRPLPAWAPFLIAAVGLLLIPLMFAVPRESEHMDTFLEAIPFLVIVLGVIAFPFSRPGPSRVPGVIFAVVALASPVWFPLSMMVAQEFVRDPPAVTVQLSLLPDDEQTPYTILVPAPVDEDHRLAEVLGQARHPAWEAIEVRHGIPHLRITATGALERTYWLAGEHEDEFWPPTTFPQQGIRSDAPPYEPILVDGNVSVVVHMRIEGDGRYCALRVAYHAVAAPDDEGFARIGERDGACL